MKMGFREICSISRDLGDLTHFYSAINNLIEKP